MWNIKELSKKYTTHQIQKLLNHTPKLCNCKQCGVQFDAQSYIFRPTAIYPYVKKTCSRECTKLFGGTLNRKLFPTYVCVACNEPFPPTKRSRQRFCSRKCAASLRKGERRPEIQQWIHKIKPPRNSVSKSGTKWLDQFQLTHREHLLRIANKTVRVDGYNEDTKTVYEYLGSFWHGNPEVYQPEDTNPVNGKTFKQLYDETMSRIQLLEHHGYTVVVMWSDR